MDAVDKEQMKAKAEGEEVVENLLAGKKTTKHTAPTPRIPIPNPFPTTPWPIPPSPPFSCLFSFSLFHIIICKMFDK